MILRLVESDRPKSFGEKMAEYLAHPPQPVLRFYGDISSDGSHITFAVRNGLPLPLLYGVYVTVTRNSSIVGYLDETDHIGAFSTDVWRLTLDNMAPANVEIRLGLVPFEIMTDCAIIRVGGVEE
ncbi:MAG: hypothetical protein ACTSYX_05585 [Candidatus Thorarchaeota archaeon]